MYDPKTAMKRYQALSFHDAGLGFSLDLSDMRFDAASLDALAPELARALEEMKALEAGSIANPDENRMVGHYWLRAASLAPEPELTEAIDEALADVKAFASKVHSGEIAPATQPRFTDAVIVGIGGSSLGPLLVFDAIGRGAGGLRLHFIDNTDPDGVDVLTGDLDLATTLTVVISKSGGTKETRNGMLEMRAAYEGADLAFGPHAVAVTQAGSKLHGYATENGFIADFPMWDWVGGRTSVTSAVGLLPTALSGANIDALLAGAAAMDTLTRRAAWRDNPGALLAAAWHLAGDGIGSRNMVLLPYKDRLALTSRYLQQLVMESLGKAKDLRGETVHQGLTVYGNKGSTDQHAYVQQLLDGPDDFFVTFIEVLRDRQMESIEVEPGVTSGDYLSGFLQGTRRALAERDRTSLTLTFDTLDPTTMGAVIALYERAVGLYASLVRINAYHQPGVESGKKAAADVLAAQGAILTALSAEPRSASEIADAADTEPRTTLDVLRHLAANGRAIRSGDGPPWAWTFTQA